MRRAVFFMVAFPLLLLLLAACGDKPPAPAPGADQRGHTAPTKATAKANAEFGKELDYGDRTDFQNAARGLIAGAQELPVRDAGGRVVWNPKEYAFIKGQAPASVNPSLWRHERLNNLAGLFKVTEGVFQARGLDLANMSLIRGETGWIVVDPLTTSETAGAAMALVKKHLGDAPIRAVIFTHSHMDHFGGVLGVISRQKAEDDKVRIIAPLGFLEEATSENIIAGVAMGRRAMYSYGRRLAKSERGHVGAGLGKGVPFGTFGILEPTETVARSGEEKTIDGVRFVFQYAPDSEAPVELTFYLPAQKAFCGADIVCHSMHNLYTLRGAKVRDALKWSGTISQALELFPEAEVYFGGHHWPIWGRENIRVFLEKQRDLYKYIHDQTVRYINQGLTPLEICRELRLPASLDRVFANRGYYGSLKHNVRAVYQFYLGWYDANPARLDPLPPEETGKRYVAMMGGPDQVLKRSREYFDQGEYRWVAQVLNHLVFAEPGNQEAKALLARAYDQLGYQAESATWRDIYLTGAYELRHGAPEQKNKLSGMKALLESAPVSYLFDSMAVRLNGPKAEGEQITVRIVFKDLGEAHELKLENSVLRHRQLKGPAKADVTLTITHALFLRLAMGQAGLKEMVFSDDLAVEGSRLDLLRFLLLFEKPEMNFNIVTP